MADSSSSLGMVSPNDQNSGGSETGDSKQSDSKQADDKSAEVEATRGKVGDDKRPVCPEHYCLMVGNGTKSNTAHFKCQVKGCKQSQKIARPLVPAPKEPTFCPRCANGPNRDGKGKQVACRVDVKAVRFNVVMRCPTVGCEFAVEVPRGFEKH